MFGESAGPPAQPRRVDTVYGARPRLAPAHSPTVQAAPTIGRRSPRGIRRVQTRSNQPQAPHGTNTAAASATMLLGNRPAPHSGRGRQTKMSAYRGRTARLLLRRAEIARCR